VTSTALLNHNNAPSIISQRTEELQDEFALPIAEIRAQSFRARKFINQSRRMIGVALRMREDAMRMRIFLCDSKETLSELYCQLSEMSEAPARDQSNLNGGYSGVVKK
jgi:hypothetical protein